jgi:hypothetical protein
MYILGLCVSLPVKVSSEKSLSKNCRGLLKNSSNSEVSVPVDWGEFRMLGVPGECDDGVRIGDESMESVS